MIRKVRTCDVCGKVMSNFATKYKIQKWWFNPRLEEEIKVYDMCEECYYDYRAFVVKKRSDNSVK